MQKNIKTAVVITFYSTVQKVLLLYTNKFIKLINNFYAMPAKCKIKKKRKKEAGKVKKLCMA